MIQNKTTIWASIGILLALVTLQGALALNINLSSPANNSNVESPVSFVVDIQNAELLTFYRGNFTETPYYNEKTSSVDAQSGQWIKDPTLYSDNDFSTRTQVSMFNDASGFVYWQANVNDGYYKAEFEHTFNVTETDAHSLRYKGNLAYCEWTNITLDGGATYVQSGTGYDGQIDCWDGSSWNNIYNYDNGGCNEASDSTGSNRAMPSGTVTPQEETFAIPSTCYLPNNQIRVRALSLNSGYVSDNYYLSTSNVPSLYEISLEATAKDTIYQEIGTQNVSSQTQANITGYLPSGTHEWFAVVSNSTHSSYPTSTYTINVSCDPNWTCEGYPACGETQNSVECNLAVDQNQCGENYTGDYSEFETQSCVESSGGGGGGNWPEPETSNTTSVNESETPTLSVAPSRAESFLRLYFTEAWETLFDVLRQEIEIEELVPYWIELLLSGGLLGALIYGSVRLLTGKGLRGSRAGRKKKK